MDENKNKNRPTVDPIFRFWSDEGNIMVQFFFWPNDDETTATIINTIWMMLMIEHRRSGIKRIRGLEVKQYNRDQDKK